MASKDRMLMIALGGKPRGRRPEPPDEEDSPDEGSADDPDLGDEGSEDDRGGDDYSERCAQDAFDAYDKRDPKAFVEAIRAIAGR